MEGDYVAVRGFNKLGKVVHESPVESQMIVEFEKIRLFVDKKTRVVIFPSNCVIVQDQILPSPQQKVIERRLPEKLTNADIQADKV